MPKLDEPYLILISKYTKNILKYTHGMTLQDFGESDVTYDACILNFINIGEALKSLSENFKKSHPKIPYQKIIGLRNIAAHSYEGLEAFRLFRIIKEDIPDLRQQILQILEDEA